MANKQGHSKIMYMLEEGESIVDIAIEMGKRGFNSMKIPKSNIHIMASNGKGNAFDFEKGEHYRVFSLAYDKYLHPIHYIFLGTKEKGWKVTTDDSQIDSIYQAFLKELNELSINKVLKKSFISTGLNLGNIRWSGKKAITVEDVDLSPL